MENILSLINDLGYWIGSLSESLNYDTGAEIFYVVVSLGLNFICGFGFCLALCLPFIIIYWVTKFVSGGF